ncbi:MAG: response regulator [Lachnospiraceae bacterium]|nr:response regulator [Lachnospiraceae bacterium]
MIVLVLYQYSIVVKGIEKKLQELGYKLIVLENDFEKVEQYVEMADMFLLYLHPDIMEDYDEKELLKAFMEEMESTKALLLTIGEKKIENEVFKFLPALKNHGWMNRPVKLEDLELKIEDMFIQQKKMDKAMSEALNKRVLIVDDDPGYAKMVREWMKDYYSTSVVTSGAQAFNFLAKKQVDLVLLDYEMPVANGPQVLQMLKAEPNTADIPVVFLTGVGDLESVKSVMALRPAGYILKSTPREDLLKYIEGILEKC